MTRRAPLRALGLALTLAAAAIVWRAASETPPPARVKRTLPVSLRLPGGAPALAWPGEGEAAVQAQGVAGASASTPGETPVPIASIAKVMTAYLTLLAHPLAAGQEGFVVTVTPAEAAEEREREALDESVVPVRSGERLTERQALQAMLLPSANNIAALLASYQGGMRAFLVRMNATAKRLGMRSTTYTDPSGYAATTVSTAADQLKLAQAAMRLPAFAALVDERAVALPVAGRVLNVNALVGHDGYVGIKTGSDSAAGGCLMFAKRALVSNRPVTILGVVLGQRAGAFVEAALAGAQRLGDSAAAALHLQTVLAAGSRVLSVSDADGRRTLGATSGALRTLGWAGMSLRVNVSLRAPARQLRRGAPLATVSLAGGVPTSATAAVATAPLAGPSLSWRLEHLL